MSESLELLLEVVCKNAERTQQNAQQTLYQLETIKDARLAHDILVTCGVDVRLVPDGSGAKLYVHNASVAASDDKIRNALAAGSLFKQIKNVLDEYNDAGDYTLTLSNNHHGRQLTLQLPTDDQLHGIASKKPEKPALSAQKPAVAATSQPTAPRPKKLTKEEDQILSAGPSVARAAIPDSFKSSNDATEEDPLRKRMMFWLTSRAFTSGAYALGFLLVLGLIFSVLVTVKGFLCPDVVMTDRSKVPAFCGSQKSKQANAIQ